MLDLSDTDGAPRRLGPFVAPGVVSMALLPLSATAKPGLITLAAFLGLVSILGTALTSTRAPSWWRPLPVYLVFPVVALLRDAHGGTASGYAPLALLPVLWLGLYGTRRELLGAVVLLGATFTVPLLVVQGPAYPVGSWRLAVLMTLTALVIGLAVQHLTRQLRRAVEDQQAIARAARAGTDPGAARGAICRAACEVSGAGFAVLLEPDAAGRTLTSTARHGLEEALRLPMAKESSASAAVLRSGRPVHIPDSRDEAAVSSRLAEQTGAVGALLHPVKAGGVTVAVLALGFDRPLRSVPPRLEQTLEILAAEAASMIERVDLYEQLGRAALTDGLTGAANRRAWDAAVAARREQAPTGPGTVVALLDLDHFKAYNDMLGHLAGDELLQACVTAWRQDLRATDVLARWGGEEFAVLLPDCSREAAGPILERLRRSVPGGCTVSVGATHADAGQELSPLVQEADGALYRAKGAGRDRLTWHVRPDPADQPDRDAGDRPDAYAHDVGHEHPHRA